MFKLTNSILVILVLASATALYSLEFKTRGLEREIARTRQEISDTSESIKLLNAEWSSLTRPERIQRMAEKELNMQVMKAQQVVRVEDLAGQIPDAPEVKLEKEGSDPIGDILKKMQ